MRHRELFVVSCCLALMALGCAHKTKASDDQDISGAASNIPVQSQNLNFNDAGSDSGKIKGLSTIHFDFDRSILSIEARKTIRDNLDWLEKHPGTLLEIQGHCDRHGSTEYNLALGDRRAKAVLNYMISVGANPKFLSTISYGKEKLIDTSETDEADRMNRRANFAPRPMSVQKLGAR